MSTGFDYVARNINVDTIQPLNRGARDPITVNQIVKDVANFNGQVVSPSGGSSTVTSPHEFRNFAQAPN